MDQPTDHLVRILMPLWCIAVNVSDLLETSKAWDEDPSKQVGSAKQVRLSENLCSLWKGYKRHKEQGLYNLLAARYTSRCHRI